MAQIISMATRKQLGGQNFPENALLVEQEGRYIGVLPKEDADYFRTFQEKLTCDQTTINETIDMLIAKFDEDYATYLGEISQLFMYLGFGVGTIPFDPETERIFINEDGHSWVVPRGEDE